MAIVNVKENWSERFFEWKSGVYTARQGWSVLVDDPDTDPSEIILHADLPQQGSTYTLAGLGLALGCNTVGSPRRIGPYLWHVTAEFGSFTPNVPINDDPTLQPMGIEVDSVISEEEMDTDLDNNAIVNKAGDPIRGIMTQIHDELLTITKNYSSFNAQLARSYRGTINNDFWNGYPPHTVKINKIRTIQRVWNGWPYYDTTFEFQTRWMVLADGTVRTWDVRPLNLGLHAIYIRNLVFKKERIKLEDGTYATEPILLNQSGAAVLNPSGGALGGFRIGPFRIYPEKDFSDLNIIL